MQGAIHLLRNAEKGEGWEGGVGAKNDHVWVTEEVNDL